MFLWRAVTNILTSNPHWDPAHATRGLTALVEFQLPCVRP